MTPAKLWSAAAVLCIILEILPPPTHFFFLCMAFGALGAAVAAVYSASTWLPWVVFGVVTLVLTPILVPLAKFLFKSRPHASNVDALIGSRALVVEPIDSKTPGVVRIRGEVWRAMSDQERFEKDQWVEVVHVEGTHVTVRRPG